MTISKLAAALLLGAAALPAHAAITFGGALDVAGDATDLATLGNGPNLNRLSFGSDLTYNARTGTFYGISDRGPGGGTIDWAPRVEAFKIDVSGSAAPSNFQLQSTTVFRQANGQVYSGLFPNLIPGGSSTNLNKSLDSEGIVRLSNGHFLVADEYGPSIYEMDRNGKFLRAFTQPSNILPKVGSTVDYVATRPTLTSGRQDNRGYEGLTVSADGKTAWGILQDPLVNEGASNDGRRSQNLRIVQFDVATGVAQKQFAYQLEALSAINGRIPGTADDFSATNQGRSIGVSSLTWIGGTKFLVIERDNRGQGPDNIVAGALQPSGTKRIYMIDIAGASDVSGVSFVGSNSLPSGVVPVGKSLFIDVQSALLTAGLVLPEKLEGLAIGPKLAGGGFALILATDNDFSVTQGSGVQTDVCTNGVQVALGAGCPTGSSLVPSRLYSFAVTGDDAKQFDASLFAVPEPATWSMMIAGFGLVGGAMRRRATRVTTSVAA
nr:esterase-like activity of phytase family protein [Polymorphobacter arshaanensis]